MKLCRGHRGRPRSCKTARVGRTKAVLMRRISAYRHSAVIVLLDETQVKLSIAEFFQLLGLRQPNLLILSAASRHLLHPLPPPARRLEGVREVLCLVHDLAVAELHNAHRICQSP